MSTGIKWLSVLVAVNVAFSVLGVLEYDSEITTKRPTIASFAPLSLSESERSLVNEHCPWGLPSADGIAVRQGYVRAYDPSRRISIWSAYHVKPEYRRTPTRESRFSSFRKDPDVETPVQQADYNGLLASRGFARGHLAPYFVMGGDRDGDGEFADLDASRSDLDDEKTVLEANYMTNIAPQHHSAFNGSGGIWFKLETYIREQLVEKEGREVWVVTGCILGPKAMEKIGPNKDIEVPPAFFQIIALREPDVDYPMVGAFLLPHHRERHGEIEDFMVSVDVIEALTGLDFFRDLDDDLEDWLEDADTFENWGDYFLKNE